MQPIRIKLTLTLLVPTIIFCIGLLLFITNDTTATMSKINDDHMNDQLKYYADYVNGEISAAEFGVHSLVDYTQNQFYPSYLPAQTPAKKEEAYAALSDYVRHLSSVYPSGAFFIYFLPNNINPEEAILFRYSSTLKQAKALAPLDRSYFVTDTLDADKFWYFESIKNATGHWYGPQVLHNLSTSGQSVVFSQCAYADGEPYALIGYERPTESLKSDLSKIKYYQTGYIALINEQRKMISHPTIKEGSTILEALGPSFEFIDKAFASAAQGRLNYLWTDHRQKTLQFMPLSNHWTLILTAYMDEVMRPSVELSRKLITVFIIATLLIAAVGYLLGLLIARPLVHLSRELSAFTFSEDLKAFTRAQPRSDQYGELAQLFYDRCSHYLEKKLALKNHMDSLSNTVEERNGKLIESHQRLIEKRHLIQASQQQIKEQNHMLESSINTVLYTQTKLVEQEKMISFSEIIRGVAMEIHAPMMQCLSLIEHQDDFMLRASRKMLRSEYSRSNLMATYELTQKNNRQLLGNLMFSKDIVDYIKDLTTSNSAKSIAVIELSEYLEKASAQLDKFSLDYTVDIHIASTPLIYLETDVIKFLHLISSLLIHMATLPRAVKKNIQIIITPSVVDRDLYLRFMDRDDDAFTGDRPSITTADSRIHMGIQMIELIMRESFSGALTSPEITRQNGNVYELHFPQITVSAN